MVQGQGFCIITWKPTIERASLIGKLGMCWADLWTEPYEPSPVPSSNTVKVFLFVDINFRGFVKNYKFVDSYIRGFCVCTKIKFHWVSKLWESFNTLDKWAVELCNRQWNVDINVFIFSIFFYIYQLRIWTKSAFEFHNCRSVQISVILSNLKIKKKSSEVSLH
jgi:hypothetical protein